ncbi:fibronectin type III domain-containing protein [Saccharopolyspora shandongensis]|uniref:fibronectin type III domain-containing protein n=1 Tax=Saccharopolyspora shandongensis TaxID=418495 RepID=UPI0033C64940
MTDDSSGSKSPALQRLRAVARGRAAIALLVAGCVGLVGLAVTGQASVPPGLQFVQVGHWVYNSASQSAFHVDGSTGQVDARASVPGAEQGSQVVQGERSGYVVERSRITEFSKSTLSVENSVAPPAAERPVVLEVAGGPYLVYRNAGRVARLGDPTATVPAGGPLSMPVATSDGTVWLHRIDTGSICQLPGGAARLACPAELPKGHGGALAVVGDRAVVIDTTADTLHTISGDGLGGSAEIGLKLPPTAQVANSAVDGRLAVVDPDRKQLHLIDTAGLGKSGPTARPVSVDLPKDGKIAGPVAASHVVMVVDETRHEVLTYDSNGRLKSSKKLPENGEPPRPALGEDNRIYVDTSDGSRVLVVDGEDGSAAEVSIDDAARNGTADEATTEEPPDSEPLVPGVLSDVVAAATPPGAPRNVKAVAGDGSATVTWGAAANNGARITRYRLSWPGGSTTVDGSASSATVSGLTNGKSYVITVTAENSAGRGSGASAKAVVPGRAAEAPKVTAKAGADGRVSVTWTEPERHGAELVHYLVSASGKGEREVSGQSTEFQGITGTTTITVRAVTRYGPSGSPVLTGKPGKQSVTVPSGPPTVEITGVRGDGNNRLIVSVNADAKGSSATCEARFIEFLAASAACDGPSEIVFNNVAWFGVIKITVNMTTPAGQATDSWTGEPG